MIKAQFFFSLLVLGFLALTAPLATAAKTDVVILKNGDYVTGEIKSMDRGRLNYKTDTMETVSIKWYEVVQLTSVRYHLIMLDNGLKYYGSFDTPNQENILLIRFLDNEYEIAMDQVVMIKPVERSWWERLDGYFKLGFSYTKASNVAQLTFDGRCAYRGRIHSGELKWNTIVTNKGDDNTTTRQDFSLNYERLLKRKWFATANSGFQQNDELGIDLRILLGIGTGLHVIRTNNATLTLTPGLSVNREWLTGTGEGENNLEFVASVSYSLYFYDSPKTDVTIKLLVFPSLTTSGRVRSGLNINLRREVFKDFFWDLNFYRDADNKPPATASASNDWGIVTSLGWSF